MLQIGSSRLLLVTYRHIMKGKVNVVPGYVEVEKRGDKLGMEVMSDSVSL